MGGGAVPVITATPLPPEEPGPGARLGSRVLLASAATVYAPKTSGRRVLGLRRAGGRLVLAAEDTAPVPLDYVAALVSGGRLARRAARLLQAAGATLLLHPGGVTVAYKALRIHVAPDTLPRLSGAPAAPENWPGGFPAVQVHAVGAPEDAWELLEELEETLPPPSRGLVYTVTGVYVDMSMVEKWSTPISYLWTGRLLVAAASWDAPAAATPRKPLRGMVEVEAASSGVVVTLTPASPAPGSLLINLPLLLHARDTLVPALAGKQPEARAVSTPPLAWLWAGADEPPAPVAAVSGAPPPGTPRLRLHLPWGSWLELAAPTPRHYLNLLGEAAKRMESLYRLLTEGDKEYGQP